MSLKIAVVSVSRRPAFADNVLRNIERQTLKPDFVDLMGHGTVIFNEKQAILDRRGIEYQVGKAEAHVPYGALLSACFTMACQKIDRSGFICTMEDDDIYGPKYLQQVYDCAMRNQDAILIGKASFWTSWPNIHNAHDVLWEHPDQGARGITKWMAGGTIAVNAMRWAEWFDLRFSTDPPPIDGKFIQTAWRCWSDRFGNKDPNAFAPFYWELYT